MAQLRRAALFVVTCSALAAGAVAGVHLTAADAAPAVSCVDPDAEFYSGHDIDANSLYDVVVGVPNATVAGKTNAGAVDIHYRSAGSPIPAQRIDELSFGQLTYPPIAGDQFGASTALTHLYGAGVSDECADLVIGAPGVGGGRGAVIIARGSTDGIIAAGAIRIEGRTPGEAFGSSVVASDNDVWIGAPNRNVLGRAQSGAVYHYKINGTTATLVQTIAENTANVPGSVEAGDHFGQVLGNFGRRYLVVGEPSEDVGRAVNAGAVTVLSMDFKTGLVTKGEKAEEGSPGVSGNAESGDHFGASVTIGDTADGFPTPFRGWWIAVGAPGEALGATSAAGIVYVFWISPTQRLRQHSTITQETNGVPGGSEPGDRFGSAVALDGYLRLLIGVPGEDIGATPDAGDVVTVAFSDFPATCVYRQGATGLCALGGSPSPGARVGSALSFTGADREDLGGGGGGDSYLIAIPGADPSGVTDAGEIVEPGSSPTSYVDSAGPQLHEQYGSLPYGQNNGPFTH